MQNLMIVETSLVAGYSILPKPRTIKIKTFFQNLGFIQHNSVGASSSKL